MLLKLMSGENTPDSNTTKSYEGIVLGPGDTFRFDRDDTGLARVTVQFTHGSEAIYTLQGNAYVVSEHGKTVTSFGCDYADVV